MRDYSNEDLLKLKKIVSKDIYANRMKREINQAFPELYRYSKYICRIVVNITGLNIDNIKLLFNLFSDLEENNMLELLSVFDFYSMNGSQNLKYRIFILYSILLPKKIYEIDYSIYYTTFSELFFGIDDNKFELILSLFSNNSNIIFKELNNISIVLKNVSSKALISHRDFDIFTIIGAYFYLHIYEFNYDYEYLERLLNNYLDSREEFYEECELNSVIHPFFGTNDEKKAAIMFYENYFTSLIDNSKSKCLIR